jgi:hypothetical protein
MVEMKKLRYTQMFGETPIAASHAVALLYTSSIPAC